MLLEGANSSLLRKNYFSKSRHGNQMSGWHCWFGLLVWLAGGCCVVRVAGHGKPSFALISF
jgi:hypothetical protein